MAQPVERETMEVDVLYVGGGPASLVKANGRLDGSFSKECSFCVK